MDAGIKNAVDKFIRTHKAAGNAVVSVFQDIQKKQGYLSEELIRYVSQKLAIPASRAFSVATFYSAFSLTPQGRNRIQLCSGTACHIKGAENISESLSRKLNIQPGETTEDGKFSINKVRCLGCCALAPVVKVNDDTYANVAQDSVASILEKYR